MTGALLSGAEDGSIPGAHRFTAFTTKQLLPFNSVKVQIH